MSKKSLFYSLFLGCSSAIAVDYPNMIGTWEWVNRETIVGGTTNYPAKEVFTHLNGSNPPIWIIDKQEGPLFSGKRVNGTGLSAPILNISEGNENFVAVFQSDGVNFIQSRDTFIGVGKVVGDTLDICIASILTTKNMAGCYIFKKIK